jgi:CDGSH-type Zn-finger protein
LETNMPEPIVIRCRENGPLLVPAALVQVTDHLGGLFPLPEGKEQVALCRCGHSGRKPFCDGAHKQHGFQGNNTAPPAQS